MVGTAPNRCDALTTERKRLALAEIGRSKSIKRSAVQDWTPDTVCEGNASPGLRLADEHGELPAQRGTVQLLHPRGGPHGSRLNLSAGPLLQGQEIDRPALHLGLFSHLRRRL